MKARACMALGAKVIQVEGNYDEAKRAREVAESTGMDFANITLRPFYAEGAKTVPVKKAYVASADRAQYVIEHYQQSPETGDALAILSRSYIALGQKSQAEQARKVLVANYPEHPYLTDPKWPHAPSTLRKMIPFSGHH